MNELVYWLVSAVFMVLLVICIVEYVNPLWSHIATRGKQPRTIPRGRASGQVVFFGSERSTYRRRPRGAESWNSLRVKVTPEGLYLLRPLILFGRRRVFFRWQDLQQGRPFRVWLRKRVPLRIRNSNHYFTVTMRTTRHPDWGGNAPIVAGRDQDSRNAAVL